MTRRNDICLGAVPVEPVVDEEDPVVDEEDDDDDDDDDDKDEDEDRVDGTANDAGSA